MALKLQQQGKSVFSFEVSLGITNTCQSRPGANTKQIQWYFYTLFYFAFFFFLQIFIFLVFCLFIFISVFVGSLCVCFSCLFLLSMKKLKRKELVVANLRVVLSYRNRNFERSTQAWRDSKSMEKDKTVI